jgi:hypothetical protein
MQLEKQDLSFVTNTGHIIALSYNSCQEADIQIITSKKLRCNNSKHIFYTKELEKSGALLIYCNKNSCKASNRIIGWSLL